MIKPQCSVLLPVLNGQDYLAQAILSVLQQTFSNFELLVSVNKSTDASASVARSFSDPRITVYEQESKLSIFENHNFLLQRARGDFIKFMHHDDILHPVALESFVSFLLADTSLACVLSPVHMIDSSGNPIGVFPWAFGQRQRWRPGELFLVSLRLGNIVGNPASVMFRTHHLLHTHFDETKHNSADWQLLLQLLMSAPALAIDTPLVMYRVHNSSGSTGNHSALQTQREDLSIVINHGSELDNFGLYNGALLRQHLQLIHPILVAIKNGSTTDLSGIWDYESTLHPDLSMLEGGAYLRDVQQLRNCSEQHTPLTPSSFESLSISCLLSNDCPLTYELIAFLRESVADSLQPKRQIVLFGYQSWCSILWDLTNRFNFVIQSVINPSGSAPTEHQIHGTTVVPTLDSLKDIDAIIVAGGHRMEDFSWQWMIAGASFFNPSCRPRIIRCREWIL